MISKLSPFIYVDLIYVFLFFHYHYFIFHGRLKSRGHEKLLKCTIVARDDKPIT